MIKIYYSDITNSELQQFHNQKVQNFTIKLTDALTSPLFKVETIISDNIYRIYPLFYTNEIKSTNPNDQIMDNKVIICQKQKDEQNNNLETYFTFISNPNAEIVDYTAYGQYYEIGDTLTTSEFNAIVSLLRQNTVNNAEFELNNGILHGAYADYEFDIEDSTLLDTGIVITDETITAQPKVKLSNPLFKWSKYVLKLDVIHYTGANVLDDTTDDFKIVETLEVELVKDEWVNLPVETLETGYIISLTANIQISHDEPVIRILSGLIVKATPELIQEDETTDLTAHLIDQNGYDYDLQDSEGKTVYFYEIITPSLTGLIATPDIIQIDETSEITVTVKDEDGSRISDETVYFYAVKGVEPTPPGHDYKFVVQSDKEVLSAYDEDSATLTATLTDNNVGVEGETVSFEIYNSEDRLIETLTGITNSQGVATVSYVSKGAGDLNINVECMNLQETYAIEDCEIYDITGFTKTTSTNTDTTYASGYSYSKASEENFVLEFDYNCPSAGFRLYFASTNIQNGETFYYGIGFSLSGGKFVFTERTTSTNNTNCEYVSAGNNHYKCVFEGNTVTVYINDTLQITKTLSWWDTHFPYYFNWAIWATGTGTVTNIKVKPL